MSYIFGAGTNTTYEDLQRQRDIAARLAAAKRAEPVDAWSGARYLGQAIMQRMAEKRKRGAEADFESTARETIDDLGIWGGGSGGGGGSSFPPVTPGGVENTPPDALGLTDRDETLSYGPELSLGAVPKDLRPMASDREQAPSFPEPADALAFPADLPNGAKPTPEQVDAVYRAADAAGVPRDLYLRLVAQESSFSPDVWNGARLSTAGAMGPSQLMPGTARELGVDPRHIDQNLAGGARYLRAQLDKFRDPALALAAYNAGPGAVSKHNGIPPFEETQNYVRSILGESGASAGAPAGSAFKPLEVGGNTKGVDPGLVSRTAEAWAHVIPGARIEVTTGVSSHSPVNHAPGHAIDFKVIRPDGSVVQSGDPEAVQAAMIGRAMGINGIGFGPGYMGGSHMHWDISANGPRTWGDDDGTPSDRLGAGSPEIAARIAAASGRPVEEVLAELNLSAGNTTMMGGGGNDRFASGAVGFAPNPNRVDLMPMAGQPTMRPPAPSGGSGGMPAPGSGMQPPAASPQGNAMDPTPGFDGALVKKLIDTLRTAGPAMSGPEKAIIEAILQREMTQQGGPLYQPPAPVKPETMTINGRIVQVYPDGRVQEIYDSSTPEAPGAPETKDVTLPNGQKVTMQWNGQQFVPVAAPEGMPAPEAPGAPETKDVTLPNGQKVTMQWNGQQFVPVAAPEGMPGPAPEGGGDPLTAIAKLNADLDAGRITPEQHSAAMARELASKGMRIVSDGKGGVTITQGDVGEDDPRDVSAPSSPGAMLRSIEGILNDPALDWSVGWSQFMTRVPGTQAARVGARLDQLDGQTFLLAFESLKGAGQITEIEGKKATEAIGKLNRNQSPSDFRAALEDLQAVLKVAIAREEGRAGTPTPPTLGADNPIMQMTLEELRNVDLSTATTEELDAWEARWREVNQ